MPVHDWRRVDAGTFHDFHNAWIIHLKESLNAGVLPEGYYAQSEQHSGRFVGDILTLHEPRQSAASGQEVPSGGVAVAEAPPQVRKVVTVDETYRLRSKTIAIRHISDHRVVALIEIVSAANKDRPETVAEFWRCCFA